MSGIHRKQLPVRVSTRSAGGTNSSANSFEVTNGCSTNSSANASQQSNSSGSNNGNGSTKKRGRKKGSRTKLKIPQHGPKIELIPWGDEQFKYVVYPQLKGDPKYGSQMGFLLKREYLGLIKEKDENGAIIRERVATSWADYYANGDDIGVTSADRVKQEFLNVFYVNIEQKVHDDRNLENYTEKQVRQMRYQARVDGVKGHYDINGEEIDDTLACPRELEADEYKEGLVNWSNENTWRIFCNYWCTAEFLKKRKSGQEARLKSEDVAQNWGGSRPLIETQQLLALYAKLGEEIPEDLEDDEQLKFAQGTSSSHAGSHPPNNTCFNNNGGNDSGCGNDHNNHHSSGNHTTNSNVSE